MPPMGPQIAQMGPQITQMGPQITQMGPQTTQMDPQMTQITQIDRITGIGVSDMGPMGSRVHAIPGLAPLGKPERFSAHRIQAETRAALSAEYLCNPVNLWNLWTGIGWVTDYADGSTDYTD